MKTFFLVYVLGLGTIWVTYFTLVWMFRNNPKRGGVRRYQAFPHLRLGRKVPRLCSTHFVNGDSKGRAFRMALLDTKNCELCKKEKKNV